MARKRTIRFFAFVVFISGLLLFCSPERDNPYDLKSPFKRNSQIIGRIMTKVGNPIADAQICLIFQDVVKTVTVISDSNGNYNLKYSYDIEQGDSGLLVVSRINFADYEKTVEIGVNKADTVNFLLNALPQFSAESITSKYEQLRPFPGDLFSVIFSVRITDADGIGDIDSVMVKIPSMSYALTLNYDHNNIYNRTVQAELLPGANLENLIGVDCYFIAFSKPNLQTQSTAFRLTRIIYEIPEQIFPVEDTVSNNFNCVWRYLSTYYPFTCELEVYYLSDINPVPILAYDTTSIMASDTIINIQQSFITGRYLWQVSVRDNYGNIGKSNRVLFFIQP